jgi:hypothetical protein
MRLASIVICLIVIASFAIFVVNQTSSASTQQQEAVSGRVAAQRGSSTHESSVHKAIDDASDELTSPFSGITSGSSSQWAIRGVNLLLALIVYGFGLGFLARVVRVRT